MYNYYTTRGFPLTRGRELKPHPIRPWSGNSGRPLRASSSTTIVFEHFDWLLPGVSESQMDQLKEYKVFVDMGKGTPIPKVRLSRIPMHGTTGLPYPFFGVRTTGKNQISGRRRSALLPQVRRLRLPGTPIFPRLRRRFRPSLPLPVRSAREPSSTGESRRSAAAPSPPSRSTALTRHSSVGRLIWQRCVKWPVK